MGGLPLQGIEGFDMESRRTVRQADSRFVHAVTNWVIGNEKTSIAAPDGRWDIVVLKQNGQTTQAVYLFSWCPKRSRFLSRAASLRKLTAPGVYPG